MRHDLFSTPLWHITGASEELVDELYKKAYQFKEEYKSTNISNQGGYQSPPFSWEDFQPQGILYINSIIGDIIGKFKVTGWWYNINGKGHWNSPHTHPDSDVALVFYLTDSDGLLHLMNPFPQRRIDKHGDHISVKAKKGDIVMFPSDINHYVNPNERDMDRISISMNLQLC